MRILPRNIEKLIDELSKLPGIGPKTASRLTFYLYKLPDHEFDVFTKSVAALKSGVLICSTCFNMAESATCEICADPKRIPGLICVVEDPLDVLALEQTRKFGGLYHVLGGAISPIEGIGPRELKIAELVKRVSDRETENLEIILATNPTMEGDATAMYITKQLKPFGVKITKLGRGIPVGGDLEYTDEQTLADAINYRKEV